MSILVTIIHIIVSIALIMIVLLQTGKGADMGAAFGGGGSQTLFGASGASTFLSKATTVAAIVFMLTSLFLAYSAGKQSSDSILSDLPKAVETTAPATAPAATTPSSPPAQPEKQPPAAPATSAPASAAPASAADTKPAEPPVGETSPKK